MAASVSCRTASVCCRRKVAAVKTEKLKAVIKNYDISKTYSEQLTCHIFIVLSKIFRVLGQLPPIKIAPNPESNLDLDPNPNPNGGGGGAIFIWGQLSGYRLSVINSP